MSLSISVTPDDIAGMIQRRCRQLERALDMPQVSPDLLVTHIDTMLVLAQELARLTQAAQTMQTAANANGEAKAN